MVVGDEGYIALSDGLLSGDALDFEVQATPTSADLWAVSGECTKNGELLATVVGDGVLLLGTGTPEAGYEWFEPTPPSGGWGRLRDVGPMRDHTCAIGDAGRVVCSANHSLWEPVELDTSADLTSLCRPGGGLYFAVGEAGTLVTGLEPNALSASALEPAVDLVACSMQAPHDPAFVGAERRVYVFDAELELRVSAELDWQPRALDPQEGRFLAGDQGRVGTLVLTGAWLQ